MLTKSISLKSDVQTADDKFMCLVDFFFSYGPKCTFAKLFRKMIPNKFHIHKYVSGD